MKIACLSLQFEANTFVNARTKYESFDIYRGEEMLELIPCMDVFEAAGAEVLPILYANSVPGPVVEKEAYLKIHDEIMAQIPETGLDGIWIYFHGSMQVEGIGSGELYLCNSLRARVGNNIPISLALDLHANNAVELMDMVNILYGYRTAPHRDQPETQRRAAELLVKCIKEKLLPKPVYTKIPIIAPGELSMTGYEPLKSVMRELERVEAEHDILCASFFVGHAWVDVPNGGGSAVVIPYHGSREEAADICRGIAMTYWNGRHEIGFRDPTATPEEAIEIARENKEFPLFISETGDNITAGTTGDDGWYLEKILESGLGKVLYASIADKPAVDAVWEANVGDEVQVTVGGTLSPDSAKTQLRGKLLGKATTPSWSSEEGCRGVVLACGGVHVVIAEIAVTFTTKDVFDRTGLQLGDYETIVVKSGYLFPDISKYAARSIMAITPGASYEDVTQLTYVRVPRPMYPLDKDFEFTPSFG